MAGAARDDGSYNHTSRRVYRCTPHHGRAHMTSRTASTQPQKRSGTLWRCVGAGSDHTTLSSKADAPTPLMPAHSLTKAKYRARDAGCTNTRPRRSSGGPVGEPRTLARTQRRRALRHHAGPGDSALQRVASSWGCAAAGRRTETGHVGVGQHGHCVRPLRVQWQRRSDRCLTLRSQLSP